MTYLYSSARERFCSEQQVPIFRDDSTCCKYTVPESALSPDGKHMAVVNRGSQRYELVVVALEDSEPEMIAIESVDRQWISNNFFAYRPLAWASDERLIYAKHGWQKGGIHEGKRGLAIMAANIKDKTIEEIYFMELPLGCYLRDQPYVPQKDKVYLTVSQATGNSIWEMDLKTSELRLIKDRLPTYDGFFHAKISPDGSCYVYNLYEEDRMGIFILDVTTGEERPLLPNGDTMSFYPDWSPDGRYVAAYTVDRVPGTTGVSWKNYKVFPGEDGPQPISTGITVVDKQGKVVQEIKVDDRFLSNFQWAKDSPTLGFMTGLVIEEGFSSGEEIYSGYFPQVAYDGIWLVQVDGKSIFVAPRPASYEKSGFIDLTHGLSNEYFTF